MTAARQQLGLFDVPSRTPTQATDTPSCGSTFGTSSKAPQRPTPPHSAATSLDRLADLRCQRRELVELAHEAGRARQSGPMSDYCATVRARLAEVRAEEARYRSELAMAYGVVEDELEDALATQATEDSIRDAEEAALAEAEWRRTFAALADLRAVRAEVVEEFEEHVAGRRELAEAIELGRHLRKKAGSRRRAHESAVRLGKITGARNALATARAAPPPLLAALKAQLARQNEDEPRGAGKRIRLRRDGEVIRTVEVAR